MLGQSKYHLLIKFFFHLEQEWIVIPTNNIIVVNLCQHTANLALTMHSVVISDVRLGLSSHCFLLCLPHHNGNLPGHKFYVLSRKKNYFELCSSLNQSDSGVIPGLFSCFQTVMATHCLLNGPALLINSTLLCICLGTQL